MYDNIQTIRYMGNKNRLLDFIIPEIEKITEKGAAVCDLMSGTNSVGYALKRNYKIVSNDVQKYSECIARAIIVNNKETINAESAAADLGEKYRENLENAEFDYFYKTYPDTYFSARQCLEIDSLRFAIENIEEGAKKSLYLTALMGAMCKVQSTPGHFAQFMPKQHRRIVPLRAMSVWDEFLQKCGDFDEIVDNGAENKAFCLDYKELLKSGAAAEAKTFYLDSPYSAEQYSRFYHILETVVRYDRPEVSFKAKYRCDRFMSGFCYKAKVGGEFENIIKYCRENGSNLVISYSDKGVIGCEELLRLCKKYYPFAEMKKCAYSHSTMGKGSGSLSECLFILKN